jgi:hypothetical protein
MSRRPLLAIALLFALTFRANTAAPPAHPWTSCWADLASANGARGYSAVCRLADHPRLAVPYLRARLRPITTPDAGRIARLIARLDSDHFETRQKASAELERLAELAQPALLRAKHRKPTPEVRKRVDELLRKLERPVTAPEKLRQIRAVEALERMGTPEAQRLLEELAKGAPAARLTREAKESLERLARRTTKR